MPRGRGECPFFGDAGRLIVCRVRVALLMCVKKEKSMEVTSSHSLSITLNSSAVAVVQLLLHTISIVDFDSSW